LAIGIGLGTVMAMSLHMNGPENYELHELTLPRRLGIWPPPIPGFKANDNAGNADYPYTSQYQETLTQHWQNVVLCIPYSIICVYMLLGLNTVCDAYFTGALDVMVNMWNVQPDVAGATFMAAGGSAPEFFTSIIGACLAESDVGFGTIVGSAVFNVLFVIGACGVAALEPIPLSWWPLFRDCSFYIVGLGLLATLCYTVKDGRDFSGREWTNGNPIATQDVIIQGPNGDVAVKAGARMGCPPIPGIEHWEAVLLFVLYLSYCGLMFFNEKLEAKVMGRKKVSAAEIPPPQPKVTQVAPEPETDGGDKLKEAATGDDKPPVAGIVAETPTNALPSPNHLTLETEGSEHRTPSKEGGLKAHTKIHSHHHYPHTESSKQHHGSPRNTSPRAGGSKHEDRPPLGSKKNEEAADASKKDQPDEEPPETKVEVPEDEAEEEDDDEGDDIEEMMMIPEDTKNKIIWYICSPVYAHLYYCTPKPEERKVCGGCMPAFIACFLTSLLWIALYSTVLVWLVTEIGAVFGFPEIVMGFTILAAGTSIPDLVSSMAVARAGQGDMAVSSSIGSNIFDILVGLPIPWLVKILIVEGIGNNDPSFLVVIGSPYIPFYVLLLLMMVGAVVVTIHCMKWLLNKWLGVVMVVLYIIFLGVVLPTSYDAFEWLNFAGDGRTENPKVLCPPDPLKY
jgi:Ca2+/Na+ antiporter